MSSVGAARAACVARTACAARAACAVLAASAVFAGLAAGSAEEIPRPAGYRATAAGPAEHTSATPQAERERPALRASRSAIRSKGPHTLPKGMPGAACAIRLPAGGWKLDLTAARTLSTLAALAYKESRPIAKAARAFEHSLRLRHRYTPSTYQAREMIRRNSYPRGGLVPHTWAVDAVLALYSPHALTCTQPIRTLPQEQMLTNGLTLRTQTMIYAFFNAYGGRYLGGFAPGGITSGHIENSAHYDGRAVDIFYPRKDPDNRLRGWLLAHWLVAHADTYSIATVIFDDLVWTRVRSAEGWHPYIHPSGNRKNPTLRHLDHIHVDVVNGKPQDTPNAAPAGARAKDERPARNVRRIPVRDADSTPPDSEQRLGLRRR